MVKGVAGLRGGENQTMRYDFLVVWQEADEHGQMALCQRSFDTQDEAVVFARVHKGVVEDAAGNTLGDWSKED